MTGHGSGFDIGRLSKQKLTPRQRDQIRQRYADGETAADLAQEFGVTRQTIYDNTDAREPGAHR